MPPDFFAEMPEARARRKGGAGGGFHRTRAFRRSEAEAVSRRDWLGKKFGFCSGDTAVNLPEMIISLRIKPLC